MKIEMTRNTICDRRPVLTGEIVETDEAQGRMLVLIGKARPYVEPEPAEVPVETAEDIEPMMAETRVNAPARTKKGRSRR